MPLEEFEDKQSTNTFQLRDKLQDINQSMFLKRNPVTLSQQKCCCIEFAKGEKQDNPLMEAIIAKLQLTPKADRITHEVNSKKSLKRPLNNASLKQPPRNIPEMATVKPFFGNIEHRDISLKSPNLTNNQKDYLSFRNESLGQTVQKAPQRSAYFQQKDLFLIKFTVEKKSPQISSASHQQFQRFSRVRNCTDNRFYCRINQAVSARSPLAKATGHCIRTQNNSLHVVKFIEKRPDLIGSQSLNFDTPPQKQTEILSIEKDEENFCQNQAVFNTNVIKHSELNSTEVDMFNSGKRFESSIVFDHGKHFDYPRSAQSFCPLRERSGNYLLSDRKDTIQSKNDESSIRESQESIMVSTDNMRATYLMERKDGLKLIPGLLSNIFA